MNWTSWWLVVALASLIFAAMVPESLSAQSIWVNQKRVPTLSVEVLKPSFDGNDRTTFATSALFLSLRAPVSEDAVVVADLPFAHGGTKSSFGTKSNTLGNPYIGVEAGNKNSPVFGEFGIRIPLAKEYGEDDFATAVGLFSDFDRYEAFLPDVFSLTGLVNYRYKDEPSGLTLRLRGGPSFLVYTDSRSSGDDGDALFNYSAQLWHEGRRVSIGGGLVGRAILSESDLSLSERTIHQFGLAATFDGGAVQPGVYLRLPLDHDLSEVVNLVFGVNLGFPLK